MKKILYLILILPAFVFFSCGGSSDDEEAETTINIINKTEDITINSLTYRKVGEAAYSADITASDFSLAPGNERKITVAICDGEFDFKAGGTRGDEYLEAEILGSNFPCKTTLQLTFDNPSTSAAPQFKIPAEAGN